MVMSLRRCVDLTLDGLCASTMAAIVLMTTFQVGNRYALHYPISWTDEGARFLAVWVVLLGATRCVRDGSHIHIDLFVNMMKARAQWWVSLLVNVIFIALVCILIWQGIKILPVVGKQTAAASRISMAWVYSAVPLTGGIMLFYLVESLIKHLRHARTSPDDSSQTRETDIV